MVVDCVEVDYVEVNCVLVNCGYGRLRGYGTAMNFATVARIVAALRWIQSD